MGGWGEQRRSFGGDAAAKAAMTFAVEGEVESRVVPLTPTTREETRCRELIHPYCEYETLMAAQSVVPFLVTYR